MIPVSVVIITKNEASIVGRCIDAAKQLTDDIVVVDNGSTDETLEIAIHRGCRVLQQNWHGYGANKNKGNEAAKYDWILSLDADEVPDQELINALHHIDLNDTDAVYDIAFRTYFGQKGVLFGNWGRDHHIRLFNRALVRWNEPIVHETLILPKKAVIKKLEGRIHHYTTSGAGEYQRKITIYAMLSAQKYFDQQKKSTFVKLYLAPLFHFVKCYLLLLGFLDGSEGWHVARITARGTWLKYYLLRQSETNFRKKHVTRGRLAYLYTAKRAGTL